MWGGGVQPQPRIQSRFFGQKRPEYLEAAAANCPVEETRPGRFIVANSVASRVARRFQSDRHTRRFACKQFVYDLFAIG